MYFKISFTDSFSIATEQLFLFQCGKINTNIQITLNRGCKVIQNIMIIVIFPLQKRKGQHQPVIEQIGTYDALPNDNNERLTSFNFERMRYWIGNGASLTTPVAELLGMAGFLPIHPRTYMTAWRNRQTNSNTKLDDNKNV